MGLDEFAARLHLVAHELAHGALGFGRVVDVHLQQRARGGFHRGLPQLVGVHLAQALVTLHVELVGILVLGEHARQRALVVDVALDLRRLRILLLETEDRRLRDVDVAAVDELGHVAIEEREQQATDVRAVDIGIGHDDDAMVARLVCVERIPHARSNCSDQRADGLGRKRTMKSCALYI